MSLNADKGLPSFEYAHKYTFHEDVKWKEKKLTYFIGTDEGGKKPSPHG